MFFDRDLTEIKKDAVHGTVWAPVLEYKTFAMDGQWSKK